MTDDHPPSQQLPAVPQPTNVPATIHCEDPLMRLVHNSHDVVGLIALGNLVIANFKPDENIDIAKLISGTSESGIDVYRSSAGPAIHAHNDQFLKLSAASEDSRISDDPLYLRLSQDQATTVGTITSQVRELEILVRNRTDFKVQLAIGVAAPAVLGLFLLLAQWLAPTGIFYGFTAPPAQTATHGH